MKVLLVNPVLRDTAFYRIFPMRMPCLGIMQLARLTPEEFELKLVDEVIGDYDYENDPFSPDLVGISMVFTSNAARAYEVADLYRKRGIPVVMGGVHATFMPEEAKQHADSVCLGEADEIWATILHAAKAGKLQPFYKAETLPDLAKIEYKRPNPLLHAPSVDPGVVWDAMTLGQNGNSGLVKKMIRAAGKPFLPLGEKFVRSWINAPFKGVSAAASPDSPLKKLAGRALSRFSSPILEGFDRLSTSPLGGYFLKRTIQIERGCPIDCDFCSVTAFNGRRTRSYRIDQLLKDIDALAGDRKGVDRFFFLTDDNIVGNPKFAMEFFEALKGLKIHWISQATVQMARNEKLLKAASDSGCSAIFYGFESLDQDAVYGTGKKFKVQEYEEIIKRTHDAGIILLYGAFIFGLPGDTLAVFDKTAEFCIKNQVEMPQLTTVTPLPGARLWKTLKESGAPLPQDWSKYDLVTPSVMPAEWEFFKKNNITPQQAARLANKAYKKILSDEGIRARLSGNHSQASYMNRIVYLMNQALRAIVEIEDANSEEAA